MNLNPSALPQAIAGLDLSKVYEYRFLGVRQETRSEAWKEIADCIFRRYFPSEARRILDPAAGRGEFIGNVPGSDRWAVDLVNQLPEGAQQELKFKEGNVLEIDLPENYFDGIFVSNFLEHLESPNQIQIFLKRMRNLLRDGGHLVIMGPNFRYCYKEYFDCADHLIALSDTTVAEHLYAAGFKIEKQIPKFLPYSFRSKLPAHPQLISLYLKLPFFWRFLGKQFLMVGKR